jgi:hypothetical protein
MVESSTIGTLHIASHDFRGGLEEFSSMAGLCGGEN